MTQVLYTIADFASMHIGVAVYGRATVLIVSSLHCLPLNSKVILKEQ